MVGIDGARSARTEARTQASVFLCRLGKSRRKRSKKEANRPPATMSVTATSISAMPSPSRAVSSSWKITTPKKTAVKKEPVAKPALPEAKDDADLFDEEEEEDVIAVPLIMGAEE